LPEASQSDIAEWTHLAKASLARRDFANTEQFCRLIIDADNRHADAHFLLAVLALETQQFMPAVKFLERAIVFDATKAEYFALLGRAYAALQRSGKALEAADRAASMDSSDAVILDTIGCIYSHAGAHEKAVPQFIRAVQLRPEEPQFQYNLAVSLRFLGDFDGAETAYERAISADPNFCKAHWSLAQLRRQTKSNNHIERMEGLLRQMPNDDEAKTFLHNGLAKEYEDIQDFESAFRHLSAGKSLVRNSMEYSLSEDQRIFDAVEETFTKDLLQQSVAGYSSDEPIFIVGMPRTGTTLVERILTSHSAVYSAGELSNFGQQLRLLSEQSPGKLLDAEMISNSIRIDHAALGKAYLESTRPDTGKTQHFVDKMPLNFLNIGLIHRALPNARIVCVRRNPMDTCLSNYRVLFSPEKAIYYRYSFDLLETGRYYMLFDHLMQHWEDVLPGKVLRVDYEQMVGNQEAESRRLIDFCGLEWEDACLSFDKNTAPVATASSAQVRQPIYTNAVERWRRYEQPLQPLRDLLVAGGLSID
jgi:tetratricopeptide (TPR) repeat protein